MGCVYVCVQMVLNPDANSMIFSTRYHRNATNALSRLRFTNSMSHQDVTNPPSHVNITNSMISSTNDRNATNALSRLQFTNSMICVCRWCWILTHGPGKSITLIATSLFRFCLHLCPYFCLYLSRCLCFCLFVFPYTPHLYHDPPPFRSYPSFFVCTSCDITPPTSINKNPPQKPDADPYPPPFHTSSVFSGADRKWFRRGFGCGVDARGTVPWRSTLVDWICACCRCFGMYVYIHVYVCIYM